MHGQADTIKFVNIVKHLSSFLKNCVHKICEKKSSVNNETIKKTYKVFR